MATITWPATMKISKREELEDKLLLAFSCAASAVEHFHRVGVHHIKHMTVRCFEPGRVEVTYVVPNNDHEDVSMVRAQFEYLPDTGHWFMYRSMELYLMYQQIVDCVVANPQPEDSSFESMWSVLTAFEIKASVEIESK